MSSCASIKGTTAVLLACRHVLINGTVSIATVHQGRARRRLVVLQRHWGRLPTTSHITHAYFSAISVFHDPFWRACVICYLHVCTLFWSLENIWCFLMRLIFLVHACPFFLCLIDVYRLSVLLCYQYHYIFAPAVCRHIICRLLLCLRVCHQFIHGCVPFFVAYSCVIRLTAVALCSYLFLSCLLACIPVLFFDGGCGKVWDARSTNKPAQVHRSDAENLNLDYSPDGQYIALG